MTLLPSCDGDLTDLQGQRFTDTARDLAGDDTSLKSSVLLMGANHNYFNTVWSPGVGPAPAADDWTGPAWRECGHRFWPRRPTMLPSPRKKQLLLLDVGHASSSPDSRILFVIQ